MKEDKEVEEGPFPCPVSCPVSECNDLKKIMERSRTLIQRMNVFPLKSVLVLFGKNDATQKFTHCALVFVEFLRENVQHNTLNHFTIIFFNVVVRR